ncbi:hypothetical protein MKW94_013658 [Papaver nudicaule]|uniref:3-hydroxyisobutyryl-CoA hydrolase n=1 Tax=Papaver nudicaule TaxID=74823 RepID=A0AA41UW00_PAPNU|nr:hypothetical protein [Papaver nudicaule]
MANHGAVQVEKNLNTRTLILNRAHKLNALSSQMVSRLHEVLIACEKDPEVKLVMLRGKGKAFCVGGDAAQTILDSTGGRWRLSARFLWNLYSLVYRISTFNKPQVFAMPETLIGVVPDVGASFFLSRLPGFFGEYVGLTGAKLDGVEMLACGLATHFVPSIKLSLLNEALNKVNTSDPVIISAVIDEFSEQPPLKERSAYRRLDIIDRCFSQRTVEYVVSALEIDSVKAEDAWISEAVHWMKKASPLTLKVFLKSIRRGRLQGLNQCLAQEYRTSSHGLQDGQDTFEGIRANLVRKDHNPKWVPSRLELVTDEMVDLYFSKVDDDEWKDLVLPVRSNSSTSFMAKL